MDVMMHGSIYEEVYDDVASIAIACGFAAIDKVQIVGAAAKPTPTAISLSLPDVLYPNDIGLDWMDGSMDKWIPVMVLMMMQR